MGLYKKCIESSEELHKVMEALDALEKTYVITKEMEHETTAITKEEYSVVSWHVEEVDTSKVFFTDADATAKLVFCDGEELVLKPSYPHKFDPSKIDSIHDAIEILKRIPIYLNDESVKGVEHLIEKESEIK
ncbi:hypothetical protein COK55_27095 [Bacillus cereus]|nr:hypothetical protein COK55_27095 [Bacillus cereus]